MWYLQCKDKVISSISGWRARFDFDKKSYNENPILICFYFAIESFLESQLNYHSNKGLKISIGSDSRESGRLLLEIAKYCINLKKCDYLNLGIIPAPVIMAYTAKHSDAFIYFTASHNPKEYNGIKFGSEYGKVLNHYEHQTMLKLFENKKNIYPKDFELLIETSNALISKHSEIDINEDAYKLALQTYKNIVYKSVFSQLNDPISILKDKIEVFTKHTKKKIGILFDPNGGARTWKGDTLILEELGIHCEMLNTRPSVFSHAIVPEGESLNQARQKLFSLNSEQDEIYYPFAIVCDCDGDRGNTVFYDATTQTLRNLDAQEVFASILEIELAWNKYISTDNSKNKESAVVVNGPSSLRCEAIAKSYSTKIYRAEVGEANVVSLGEHIESSHSLVLVGEASNGGVIMFPSKVRDPLCTLFSYLKSILWAEELQLSPNILENISRHPSFVTSTTEDKAAKYTIPNIPYKDLAAKILYNFDKYFSRFQELFCRYNLKIQAYRFFNFRSTKTIELTTQESWSNINSGGLAIYFYTSNNEEAMGFVWLRPSGTEPLVRLLVDISRAKAELLTELQSLWVSYLDNLIQ